ncbi:MAG TPA: DJ-1/PfpI family protein [Drouetiella sp.]
MKIQVLLFDGFEEMDVFGVFEPLRMADIPVEFVTLRKQNLVTACYGARVVPDGVLDLEHAPDLLVVPGGGWIARSEVGAWAEAQKGEVLEALRKLSAQPCIIVSVCAGAMLLAKAGLLKGRTATTNSALYEELYQENVNVIKTRVVDDGNIITAGGITASLDLGIWLVQRFSGIESALEVSRKLEFEPRGTVWQKSF